MCELMPCVRKSGHCMSSCAYVHMKEMVREPEVVPAGNTQATCIIQKYDLQSEGQSSQSSVDQMANQLLSLHPLEKGWGAGRRRRGTETYRVPLWKNVSISLMESISGKFRACGCNHS